MTKEETVYAATLNLIGSDVLDPAGDADLVASLGDERRAAAHSADAPALHARQAVAALEAAA
jgi:hypothetical protein